MREPFATKGLRTSRQMSCGEKVPSQSDQATEGPREGDKGSSHGLGSKAARTNGRPETKIKGRLEMKTNGRLEMKMNGRLEMKKNGRLKIEGEGTARDRVVDRLVSKVVNT